MNYELILGLLLLRGVATARVTMPEEVPLAPIDFAALRRPSGRAPAEVSVAPTAEPVEALPLAA